MLTATPGRRESSPSLTILIDLSDEVRTCERHVREPAAGPFLASSHLNTCGFQTSHLGMALSRIGCQN